MKRLFDSLKNEAEEFFILIDMVGNISFLSTSAESFLGYKYTNDEIKNIDDFLHPSDNNLFKSQIDNNTIEANINFQTSIRIMSNIGEFKYFVFQVSNVSSPTGEDHLLELRTLDSALDCPDEIYNFVLSTVENSPDPVYWLDGNSQIIYVNEAVCSSLNYTKDELLKMNIIDIDNHCSENSLMKFWNRFREDKFFHMESLHKKKNGSHIMVDITAYYVLINGKEFCYAYTRDITSSSTDKYKLMLSEITYRTHYKYFPIPSYTWKYNGENFILMDYNDAAEEITSRNIKKYIGITADDFFRNDFKAVNSFEKCFNNKKTIRYRGIYLGLAIDQSKCFDLSYIFIPPDLITVHTEDVTLQIDAEEKIKVLARFPDDNPNPVFKIGKDYELTYHNSASEWLISQWKIDGNIVLPDELKQFIHESNSMVNSSTLEIVILGRIFLLNASLVSESGELYFYVTEMTEKLNAREELILAGHVFDSTAEGIMVCDARGDIVRVNPSFEKITGYSSDKVLGRNPRILRSGRHNEEFYLNMWDKITSIGKWEGEIWNRKCSGETYPSWMTIDVVKNEIGKIRNYVSVFWDITDIKKSEQEMIYQAYHDPLTGLPNRNLFQDRLTLALSQAKRKEIRAAVLFIDLDRFKIINDGLGHIIGDYILQESASRLEECIRDGDTLARIGGDEFVLILPTIKEISDASRVANRILEYFRKVMIVDGNELFVSTSIGISIYPEDGSTSSDLHKNADIAMYHAKSMGGNGYKFFSKEMDHDTSLKLKLEIDLRRALDLDQFELFYQPIVDFHNQKIVGAEALIRWNHPEMGLVSPVNFIPIAEETGIIVSINDWVMKRACKEHMRLREAGHGNFYFSVNMTSHQFVNRRIVDSVLSSLNEFDMSPENLVIEITENSIMKNVDEIIDIMSELKAMGIRFSIDDFGTGYSSLSYLKKFPLDNLKIDRSFVVDLPNDCDSNTLARTIIVLAKELGLNVIAEGVEEQEQLDFFKENYNCLIQGYYYSKPVSLNNLLLFLDKCDVL